MPRTSQDITQALWTPVEAVQAIRARIQGEWDHPQLMKAGPLGDTEDDVLHILDHTTEDE